MAAETLIFNGANVIIASRKEKELKKVTDELNAIGKGKASYIVADLSVRL